MNGTGVGANDGSIALLLELGARAPDSSYRVQGIISSAYDECAPCTGKVDYMSDLWEVWRYTTTIKDDVKKMEHGEENSEVDVLQREMTQQVCNWEDVGLSVIMKWWAWWASIWCLKLSHIYMEPIFQIMIMMMRWWWHWWWWWCMNFTYTEDFQDVVLTILYSLEMWAFLCNVEKGVNVLEMKGLWTTGSVRWCDTMKNNKVGEKQKYRWSLLKMADQAGKSVAKLCNVFLLV